MKKIFSAAVICITITAACTDQKKDTVTNADSTASKMMNNADSAAAAAGSMQQDVDFAMAAADGGMTEVKLSELAKTNASSAAVKQLADMMISDHTKAGDELKSIAAKNNLALPSEISSDHQKAVADLMAKKGADFDKAYVEQMEKDHDEAISLFESESSKGMNADLKSFADKTLPALRHHKEMVANTKAGMK